VTGQEFSRLRRRVDRAPVAREPTALDAAAAEGLTALDPEQLPAVDVPAFLTAL
jgi:hypothetical protein